MKSKTPRVGRFDVGLFAYNDGVGARSDGAGVSEGITEGSDVGTGVSEGVGVAVNSGETEAAGSIAGDFVSDDDCVGLLSETFACGIWSGANGGGVKR